MRLPLLSSKNIKKARLPYQSGFLFIMRQEMARRDAAVYGADGQPKGS